MFKKPNENVKKKDVVLAHMRDAEDNAVIAIHRRHCAFSNGQIGQLTLKKS